ncbi:MAG: UDP-2,3-diacylglucosamine diphosphatase [Bacteroidetes bacterium]|nr:UDP-2,3-diacylglucosamine diphosphatase [Bacteroidota bacterium]
MKRELDIAVISDVHLGTYGCHAKELLNYLKSIKPKVLVLNGDFIDIWQFNKRYFPKEHVQVIQRVMKMAGNGTKVYYITGNHDDALRRFSDFSMGNIHLRDKLVLQLNGKKLWLFHGDVFDLFIQYSPMVSRLGGQGYDWLIRLNRFINAIRARLGKPRMSFAGKVKNRVKEAVKFVSDFEETAIRLAGEQGYDYVVCGHIHMPQMRNVGDVCYMNSGDWVENLTALEYAFGRWTMFEYDEAEFETSNPKLRVKDDPLEDEEDVSTEAIFASILKEVNLPNELGKMSA